MIVALAGGVGGAKLARGLAAILPPEELTIVVNTGDDFEHFGLNICPDIDSVIYTLAGLNDPVRGWGLAGESWQFMDAVRALDGTAWFNLGDRDLATHVLRTQWLATDSLSVVTGRLAARLGVHHPIVPMSEEPVRLIVLTDAGELPFQRYFVDHKAQPRFRAIRFEGAEAARPAPGVIAALDSPSLRAILLCPSNPWLSIAPILAVPGIAAALRARRVPLVALSPFIGGETVKGPAAKIMREVGSAPSPAALAAHYGDLLDGLVVDRADGVSEPDASPAILATDILMRDAQDSRRLAQEIVAFAARIGSGDRSR
ncbi:2-phospho-L-lactate transferase [Novosphingobium sp. BL-52-GroH]|uniref:2-phospho-L-lactate transferase n=1 Tax=Novosphingobium sp. BL-52-GroH TaxID=3349877 RepID=UPI0038508F0E